MWILSVKNNFRLYLLLHMDKFLKRNRDIDEVDAKSDQKLSVKKCISKKAKPRPIVNTMIAI